jgi:hypothetical protein
VRALVAVAAFTKRVSRVLENNPFKINQLTVLKKRSTAVSRFEVSALGGSTAE